MEGARSFGAGRAGAAFDPVSFVKQPQTILRILSWIFSIVVFGSIVNEGYINIGSERLHCIFNKNNDACNYGITIGVIAFLASTLFFILDIHFPQISSVKDRKKAVLVEIGFSGFWTFMWFVGFCFLANQWQRTSPKELPLNQGADAARAAIAFSFFSIITWVGNPDTQKRNAGATVESNVVKLEVLGYSVEGKPGAQSRVNWGGEIVHYGATEKQAPLKYGRKLVSLGEAHTCIQGWEVDN